MNWVFLVLAAAALWGVTNIIDQVLRTKHIKDSFNLTIYFGLFGLIFLLVLPFKHTVIPDAVSLLTFLVIGILWIFSMLFYAHAISIEEISRVVPIWSLSPVFVLIMAFIFLGERLTLQQLLAFFVILAGCCLISIKSVKGMFKLSKAFLPMLMSGLLFGLSNILIKLVYSKIDFWTTLVWLGIGEAVGASILLLPKKQRANFVKSIKSLKPKAWGTLLATIIFGSTGRVFYNYALMIGSVSLVYVLCETQSSFVFIYATLISLLFPKVMKEETSKKVLITKTAALSLILAGIFLIYT